jgi:hypothetical protein
MYHTTISRTHENIIKLSKWCRFYYWHLGKIWTLKLATFKASTCIGVLDDWALKWWNALDIRVVKMIVIFYFNIFMCSMKLLGVAIVYNFQNLGSVSWNPWFIPSIVSSTNLHPHVYKLVVVKCIMLFTSF